MDFDDVLDFLKRKGSIEILLEIGSGSATFQQLDEVVLVSSSTVSKRLQKAAELDFTEITQRPTDYGTEKRYELTKQGKTVLRWAQELDLDHKIQQRRRLQRECNTKREVLIDRFRKDKHVREYYHANVPVLEDDARAGITGGEIPADASVAEEGDLDEHKRRDLYRRQRDRDGTDLPDESDE